MATQGGADPLSGYRFVDDDHRRTTEITLAWIADNLDMSPARAAKVAFMSGSFARFCSPKERPLSTLVLASQYCVMFFMLDDGDSKDLHEHRAHVDATHAAGAPLRGATGIDRVFDAIIEGLSSTGSDIRPFAASWARTCGAFAEENRARGQAITLADLLARRQSSIAVHAYIYLWYAAGGRALSAEEEESTSRLRYLVAEQVILCNDLGSIDHDLEHAEANAVILLQRELSLPTRQHAVDHLVERYNRQIQELETERRRIIEGEPTDRMRRVTETASAVVDGNLRTMQHLVQVRYSDSGLSRLALLDGG